MREVEFENAPQEKFHRVAIVKNIVDGDTLDVEIDLGWSIKIKERLRLEQVDTPEINDKVEKRAGAWVKSRVVELLPEGTRLLITSKSYDRNGNVRGKYGRTMAVVYTADEGMCLNRYLYEEGLAWPADERGKIIGERSLSRLHGIPAELRA